jgi:hypothetical protein
MTVAPGPNTPRFQGMGLAEPPKPSQTLPCGSPSSWVSVSTRSNAFYYRCALGDAQAPATESGHRRTFPQVKGGMVGLPGLEPGTSSLSAKCREPLCYTPFSQVALHRDGEVMWSLAFSYVLSSRASCHRPRHNCSPFSGRGGVRMMDYWAGDEPPRRISMTAESSCRPNPARRPARYSCSAADASGAG